MIFLFILYIIMTDPHIYAVYMRNRLLNILCTMLEHSNSQMNNQYLTPINHHKYLSIHFLFFIVFQLLLSTFLDLVGYWVEILCKLSISFIIKNYLSILRPACSSGHFVPGCAHFGQFVALSSSGEEVPRWKC